MSRFAEHLLDMARGHGGGAIHGLKAISRSLVEDDEDILMLLVLLGIPALLVMWVISRCIDRAHSRVRYASEYRAVDSNDYATSSSSSSDGSRSSDDDVGGNAIHQGNRRSWYRPTMDEVARAAQQLTEQEATRRCRSRRLAARYGHGEDASAQAAPDGETAGSD